MVVLCQRCGVELPEGATFCRQCGRRTGSSWAVSTAPTPTGSPESADGAHGPGNALSTLAVFFGVVAVVSVFVGVAALVLAAGARLRNEPSSRFALAVSGCGATLGLILKQLVLDAG